MMKLLKRVLTAIGGVGGLLAATCALLIAAIELKLDEAWSVHPVLICMGCSAIAHAVWCVASPIIGAELVSKSYSRWLYPLTVMILLVDVTLQSDKSEVAWFIDKISFGFAALPELPTKAVTVLRLTALAGMMAAFVHAFRQFRGFNRFVLCSGTLFYVMLTTSLFIPKLFEYIGLIIGGFVVALNWGGPIGESARNLFATVMRAFKIRNRTSGPTSFEIPTKGVNVKDL